MCAPQTLILGIVIYTLEAFKEYMRGEMLATMITGVAFFALVFAVNSSIHSYLVVRYAEGNKVAQSVGFYYMSNAAGRLMGTLVSGALYTYVGDDVSQGIGACFFAGTASALLANLIT